MTPSPHHGAMKEGGFKFALSEIESLLEVVEAIIPIENSD
jgi:hypothetical protein